MDPQRLRVLIATSFISVPNNTTHIAPQPVVLRQQLTFDLYLPVNMSIMLEVVNSDVDIDLTSVRHAEDSFMILNDHLDETSPPDGSVLASESQSESSDSSYMNIGLDDDIDDQEIDITESMDLDEQQGNQELEDVSSDIIVVILKLHSRTLCYSLTLKPRNRFAPKRIFVFLSLECIASST